MVDAALAIASYALRVSASAARLQQSTSGALVFIFNRDMFLNVPLIADFYALRDRRGLLVHQTACRALISDVTGGFFVRIYGRALSWTGK